MPLASLQVEMLPLRADELPLPHHREEEEMDGELVRTSHSRGVDRTKELPHFLFRERTVTALCSRDVLRLDCCGWVECDSFARNRKGIHPLQDIAHREC